MIRSSIDLGTNTCLLLIVEWDSKANRILRVLEDHSTIVRLGQGVDQKRELQPEAMDRTLVCLRKYAQKLQAAGGDPAQTLCVATSQARDARNSETFFETIKQELGFSFRVISGEEEARSTFLGSLLPGMEPVASVVIDIGGGSTELISMTEERSLDMGSVRFTERFLKSDPVTDEEFWACRDAIDLALQELIPWSQKLTSKSLVAVAGTATTLASWYLGLKSFDPRKIDEVILTRGDLHRLVEELKWRTIAERQKLPGMEPQRADVLLAGALILWRSLELLGFKECRVSTRGLRFGVYSALK